MNRRQNSTSQTFSYLLNPENDPATAACAQLDNCNSALCTFVVIVRLLHCPHWLTFRTRVELPPDTGLEASVQILLIR
jgi:hypothetical protein